MKRFRLKRLLPLLVALCCYHAMFVSGFVSHNLMMSSTPIAFQPRMMRVISQPSHATRKNYQQSTSTPRNETAILQSYLSNIIRMRQDNEVSKREALKPAFSLLHFMSARRDGNNATTTLHDTVIQAIRLSSHWNDYRLTLQLVNATMAYASSLDPRILGEAVRGLTTTSASLSKIKTIWQFQNESCWSRPIQAEEVNAMVQALLSRNKPRAAVELVRSTTERNAFTYSTLIQGLQASVTSSRIMNATMASLIRDERVVVLDVQSCWQWKEVLLLLDDALQTAAPHESLTNPVFAALLKLNECATENPSQNALRVLGLMKSLKISPDTVTCTLVLSSLQNEWKEALELFHAMPSEHRGWTLPSPNVYIYSAVMAVCARNQKYSEVMKLLDRLELSSGEKDDEIELNTWIYNTVLQALVKTAQRLPSTSLRKKSRQRMTILGMKRLGTAFGLLERMEAQAARNLNTRPDTVSYNTILSAVVAVSLYLDQEHWVELRDKFPQYLTAHDVKDSGAADCAQALLWRMRGAGVSRDETTYRHAVQALYGCSADAFARVLDQSVQDLGWKSPRVFHAALSVLASVGNVHGVIQLYERMTSAKMELSSETTSSFLDVLGKSQLTDALPLLFGAIRGDMEAVRRLHLEYDFPREFDGKSLGPICVEHYSSVLNSCLRAKDYQSATHLLQDLKTNGISSTDELREDMARTHALLALDMHSKLKIKKTPKRKKVHWGERSLQGAQTRARNSYELLLKSVEPSSSLLSLVAKACAATGLLPESQELLQILHRRALSQRSTKHQVSRYLFGSPPAPDKNDSVLPDLHRTLLRKCAEQGNVTFALRFCEDIQYLSTQMSWLDTTDSDATYALEARSSSIWASSFILDPERFAVVEPPSSLGMKIPEWKSLVVAAAKSGDWRVCLSTLQFLRPYLEEARPEHNATKKVRRNLERQYRRISVALSPTINCLAKADQHAWISRVIFDWIEWSGRRPPLRATVGATRELSRVGFVDELSSLLDAAIDPFSSQVDETENYDVLLYVGAITALYKDGLYDAADELFLAGVSKGILSLPLDQQTYGTENRLTLDLHGMNVAVAHSAVRIALQHEVLSTHWNRTVLWDNDMVVVTGLGRRSASRMRPVLRPEVQRMLTEEFYPPLGTTSVPGNMGALRISSGDIVGWLQHQRKQKEAKLLSIANALKNLSSGARLKAALAKAASSSEDKQQ